MTDDLRARVADAIAFHPSNRGGSLEQRERVAGLLADAVMRVVEAEQAEYDETVVGGLNQRVIRAEKRAGRAEDAIERVRELHSPDDLTDPNGAKYCAADHEQMPCPTLRALDESSAEGDFTVKTCDNASVGVIIMNANGQYLMFDRGTFPPGTAPVAGHVDDHGSVHDAAVAEVREELGLHVVSLTRVGGGWRGNRCRRHPGARGVGHAWEVYEAVVEGELAPSARETKNVRWLSLDDVRALVGRTVAYAQGQVSDAEFAERPGIESVWVQWLADLGVVEVSRADLSRIDEVACAGGTTRSDAPHARTRQEAP